MAAAPSVRVALPVPVDTLFDYAVSPAVEAPIAPGQRVLVPFGSRRLVGVVVELSDGAPPAREHAGAGGKGPSLKSVIRILDPEPVLSATMLALLREAARDVLCPVGIALAAGLPPASSPPRRQTRVAVTKLGREALARGAVHGPAREMLEALAARPRSQRSLERGPGAGSQLTALLRDGLAAVRRVEPRGPRAAKRSGDAASPPGLDAPGVRPELTPEQRLAFDQIAAAVRARRFQRFLLHGVTGSGKTEVYLRAVEEALARGRQALVLVPEITLTHQLVGRLRARFGDRLAVLHSGLRSSQRRSEWQRLRSGEVPIGVGARSALFAPLENLGVLVMDEEHDAAYKNEEGFRYHARDLGARRAAAASCPVVLGSATPSLETRFAADRDELERIVLPHRIGGRPLPAVEIVDLERERAVLPRGRKLILSRALIRGLRSTLAEGDQAILFLNRRGFSTRIFCFDCGHAERCKNCDISLVYHAAEGRLRCHYCDFSVVPPDVCSGCGADGTALLGLGTERVEEEVRIRFPEARIARLDRDTAVRRGRVEAVLRDLAAGRIDVLVGTQMVAKGHDFPGVRLIGVIAADLGLHLPDFRAAERTFQLLTQVAGRAGRGAAPGRVVLQTFVPDHYAIRPVREHDYESFYAEELAHRAALGYPPFARLLRALVSGSDAQRALGVAAQLAEQARTALVGSNCEVLGPAPAPLPRLRGSFRFQLLVKGADEGPVLEAGRALARAAERPRSGVRIQVDPSPANML